MTAGGRGGALGAIGRAEPRQPLLEPDLGAVEVDRDRRRQLAEQPRPRARSGDVLLGEDLLLGLGEQVRPVPPGRAQVVRAEVERRVREQRVGALVGDRGPLELEEDRAGRDRGRLLLDPLHERAALGVGGVDGEAQPGVVAGAAEVLLQLGDVLHHRGQAGGVEVGDGAARLLDARRARLGGGEVLVDAGGALVLDEGLEVPRDVGRGRGSVSVAVMSAGYAALRGRMGGCAAPRPWSRPPSSALALIAGVQRLGRLARRRGPGTGAAPPAGRSATATTPAPGTPASTSRTTTSASGRRRPIPAIRATATLSITATAPLRSFHLDFRGLTIDETRVDGRPATDAPARCRARGPAGAVDPARPRVHGAGPLPRHAAHRSSDPSDPNLDIPLGWNRGRQRRHLGGERADRRADVVPGERPSRPTRPPTRSASTCRSGSRSRRTATSRSAPVHDGRRVWHWEMAAPMASYLATVVIAPMREQTTASPAGIPIRNFFPTADYDADVARLRRHRRRCSTGSRRVFGPYPFGRVRRGRDRPRPRLRARDPDDVDLRARHARHRPGRRADRRPRARAPVVRRLGGHPSAGPTSGSTRGSPPTRSTCGRRTRIRASTSTGSCGTGGPSRPASCTGPLDPGPDRGVHRRRSTNGARSRCTRLRRTVGDAQFFAILRAWTTEHRHATATDRAVHRARRADQRAARSATSSTSGSAPTRCRCCLPRRPSTATR